MNRHDRLLKYLERVIEARRGWIPEYMDEVCGPDRRDASSHFIGLVGDIIDVVGAKRLQRLVIAVADIEDSSAPRS